MNGKYSNCASFEIIKNENYEIVLLETCKCNSKDELLMRERHHIENTNCINIRRRPIIDIEEKKEYQKSNNKKRYIENKEKINEINKKYHNANKEKQNKLHREYYKENKARLDKINKAYAIANKDKLKEYNKEYRQKRKLYTEQLKYYNL